MFLAEFLLCNKYKYFAPMSENKKGTKSSKDLSEPSQEALYDSSVIEQGYRSPIIHYTSSGTCKDSVKISSTATNCVSKGKMNYQSVITLNTKSRTK